MTPKRLNPPLYHFVLFLNAKALFFATLTWLPCITLELTGIAPFACLFAAGENHDFLPP
jgi:hypothetical protein